MRWLLVRWSHVPMGADWYTRSPSATGGSRRSERGSGTVMGVMLVFLTITLLAAVASAGNVLSVRSRVRSLGDLGALSAARVLHASGFSTGSVGTSATSDPGDEQACSVASQIARVNDLRLGACSVQGADVVVEMVAETSVPLIPEVRSTSIAGPRGCPDEEPVPSV